MLSVFDFQSFCPYSSRASVSLALDAQILYNITLPNLGEKISRTPISKSRNSRSADGALFVNVPLFVHGFNSKCLLIVLFLNYHSVERLPIKNMPINVFD